ncbi:MAG: 1-acyl-sn-glycerol-3-phosphate acyltransferase [Deltaproteobacteria bacterium]|nr:1-acyl-sn-glycerol-3-phosphate acyltransferase [Deltaproteobacteria bacterium]
MKDAALKIKNTAKVFWISVCAGLATVVLFLPITVSALLSSTGNLAFSVSRLWAHFMLLATRVRVKIQSRDRIEHGRSYIIISNHQSDYDILALVTSLGIQFRWIIKQELKSVPLFGYALYASRNIFIDRSNPASAIVSIHKGMDRLPEGASVMFFAEGTRSMDGKIQPFKKGGFVMAMDKGLPILPVTVNGSRRILPKKSLIFTPGTIEVAVGEPIETKGYTTDQLPELMDRTSQVIISQYNPDYPG